jgi:CheY-like chemotaxis protein
MPEGRIELVGDTTRLAQVLQNLLVNAVKFTDPGGRIELRVHTTGTMVVATVRDNGRGIAADALERVFELFSQEDATRSPTDAGLGIGLTLARTLVELHGGTLRAFSAGRGQGSEFTVRLPLPALQTEILAASMAESPSGPEQRRRVLVVDDNRDSADTMTSLLQVMGHEALAVYSGAEAVPAAERFAPDMVLLDLNMPGTGGFEVLQQLRALPAGRPVHVAAMTGYGQEGDRQRTLEAGFDAHLTKPVSMEQLRRVMEQL